MDKQKKKKSSKDSLFEDISSSVKKLTSAGAVQLPNFNPKQYADKLSGDSNSLWSNQNTNVNYDTENVPETNIVPGTDTVPNNIINDTENVPETNIVPGTDTVPGTVSDDTHKVPSNKKIDTENVPGTVLDDTNIVPGTKKVPGTNLVSGTDSGPAFLDSLINNLSNSERFITLKRIIHLPVSPTSKLVLIILMNTINKAKQKVSLRSISKEYKLRWSTLLDSLAALEREEIVKANHLKDGTIIDINDFLNGTDTVSKSLYVCSLLNNKKTNNIHTTGTEKVPIKTSFEKRMIESNIRLIIGMLEVMGIITDDKNRKSGFSRAIANIIKDCSMEEKRIENILAMAVKTKEAAKSNKSGYFMKLCKEMDPDEITEEMLHEVNRIKNVYHVICNKEFDNPSLDELREYARNLGDTRFPDARSELVDYLTVKAKFIQDSVERRIERMKEWGIIW